MGGTSALMWADAVEVLSRLGRVSPDGCTALVAGGHLTDSTAEVLAFVPQVLERPNPTVL